MRVGWPLGCKSERLTGSVGKIRLLTRYDCKRRTNERRAKRHGAVDVRTVYGSGCSRIAGRAGIAGVVLWPAQSTGHGRTEADRDREEECRIDGEAAGNRRAPGRDD